MLHEDQKYIDGLLQEDRSIITEIYGKWGLECKRFVLKNNGNAQDADDIFQESLLAVLRHAKLKKVELTVPFGAYLYSVYCNLWLNTLRKQKKEKLRIHNLEQYSNSYTTLEMTDETKLVNNRIQLFYTCLEQLEVFCKSLIGGRLKKMSSNQLMELLQLPTANAVDFRMYKCRKKLKKLIEQHPHFEELFFITKEK